MTPTFRLLSPLLVLALLIPVTSAASPTETSTVPAVAEMHDNATHDLAAETHDHASTHGAVLMALPPGGTFTDDNGHIFEGVIEAIAAKGITNGCNPPSNNRFCPNDFVTRGEMAVFLVRAFGFANTSRDLFNDDDGLFFENAANRIGAAKVSLGCNPPSNTRYCGSQRVTRGQTAAFIVRAMGLTNDGGGDLFDDDNGSVFEGAIDRLRTAGITSGCNPPANTKFCPKEPVTRGQMAAFVARALGLKPITPPPAAGAPPKGQIIKGNYELKGTVNLKQDLIVDGGTLIARPGVTVNGNGFQIMFMNGGKADFQGTKVSNIWSGNGSNAKLNRDINFNGLRRIMFHQGAGKSILKYFTISNSGTPGVLGDYPLHFHLNKDTTRGTIVEGVVVRNGRNHAFVPHGSHGITFKDTVAWNTTDTPYWWDEPGTTNCSGEDKFCTTDNPNDITYDHALAYGVKPKAGDDGHRVSGFVLRASKGNVIKNSVATNVTGGADCAGYHWDEGSNKNVGGTTWAFSNNRFYGSDCHGIFVWQNDEPNPRHVVTNFTGTGSGGADGGGGIDQGAYKNNYHYVNANVPYVEIHASGWAMTGGHAGVVRAAKGRFEGTVTFTTIEIDSFTIANEGTEEPITYRLDRTIGVNTCGEIVFASNYERARTTVQVRTSASAAWTTCPLP